MIEQTQTTLYPRGNCWQYAVACLLGLPADEMPSQFDHYKQVDGDEGRWSLWYNNALQAYLKKHHGRAYVELHQPEEALAQLSISGLHLMTGTTVRSTAQDGCRHVVVGRNGVCVWDPHPSRAGLLGEIRWAVLCPYPKAWERNFPDPCVCPKCTAEALP